MATKKKRVVKKKAAPKRKKKVATKKVAVPARTASGLAASIKDILGGVPKEVTVKLGPGGIRAGAGDWDGNIYKYRY